MKRIITVFLICALISGNALAVGRKKAVYIGGTIESLNKHKQASEGELNLVNEKTLAFKVKDQTVEVPYERITALEYQNSGKYRTTAIGATVAAAFFIFPPFALVALPFALKKKKKHFLTVAYKDADDRPQAMVLELGKDIEKEARAVISARSGKEIKVITE